MGEQMTIFDVLFPDKIKPLREVARLEGEGWTRTRQELTDLCNTDPDITTFAKACKDAYCPYGLSGRVSDSGKPNTLIGYDLMTKEIKTYWRDDQNKEHESIYSWEDFAREVSDLIWSGEYLQEVDA